MSLRTFLFAAILASTFVVPHFASAAIPFLGPIIPEELGESGCPIGWPGLIVVVNRLISFFITAVIVFVAPLMIAYAGFLLVINPVRPDGKSAAKEMLWQVVIGVTIALSAYLVVNAVMVGITGSGKGVSYWTSVLGGAGGNPCLPVASSLNQAPPGGVSVVGGGGGGAGTPESENSNRQAFAAAGVSVNKAACNPYDANYQSVPGGCTNVGGLQTATMVQALNVKQSCGCSVIVTGGSEKGHASGTYSHGNGYKIDLGLNAQLNTFLEQTLTFSGERGGDFGGDIYKDTCGNEYVKESTHWDIKVIQACAL